MRSEASGYFSYLVRLWNAGSDDAPVWRASLEEPHTGERHSFPDVKSLCMFLKEQVHTGSSQDEEPQAPSGDVG